MGVDGIGSAAVRHLIRRGLDVLGLDQYNIPGPIGSSYDGSRLIWLTNHEGPECVPHVRRPISLWEPLEEEYGEQLLHRTGTIDADPADSETVRGSFKACTDYDLPYEHLSAGGLSEESSGFELSQESKAIYQPDGGFISPTRYVQAHMELAQEHGATTYTHEIMVGWESAAGSVAVETDRTTYEADHVVVTTDAQTQLLVEELEETLTPWRVIVGGFQSEDRGQFVTDSLPVPSIEGRQRSCHGGPAAGISGFKFGLAGNLEDVVDPNDFDPRPTEKEREWLWTVPRENVQQYFPEGAKSTKRLRTCMVTCTPDQDFIVDYLPPDPDVVIDARFSGKGFKFNYLMGGLLADLVAESDSAVDIDLFDINRLRTMPR